MRALLTACTAIACAATQVTLLESPLSDSGSLRGIPATRGDGSRSLRPGPRPASAMAASARVAPARLPLDKS